MAATGPQIDRRRLAAVEIFQSQHVRLRQIVHVNVIAYAGAVGRGVFVSEDFERRTLTADGFESRRDQVSFRSVNLPDRAGFVRSGGIEIAKADIAQTVGGTIG